MPLETLNGMVPWESIKDLLPIARSLKEMSLYSAVRDRNGLEGDSHAEHLLRFKQQTADYVAEHITQLEKLKLWCPIEEKVDLSSLSRLKTLELQSLLTSSPPEIPSLDVVLPASIEHFSISYQDFDLSKLGAALKPLQSLKSVMLRSPCFPSSKLQEFCKHLPESVTNLDFLEVLSAPVDFRTTTVSLRLPQLRELRLSDFQLRQQQVCFEFDTAPRLVGLSMTATAPQTLHIIKSLSRFPCSVERTCGPAASTSYLVGPYTFHIMQCYVQWS